MARLLDEFAGFNVIPSNLTIDRYTTSLERFDNQILTDEPVVSSAEIFTGFSRVTGRSDNRSNNVVNWYIQDLDTLTISPVDDSQITLFFAPVPNVDFPYPVGSTVRIENRNNLYTVDVEVQACSQDSITFTNPGNFPSTSNLFIQIVENVDNSTIFPVTFNFNNVLITQGLQGQVSYNPGITEASAVGQQEYSVAGTYTFTVPTGVTSVSAVAVGGGGGGQISRGGSTGTERPASGGGGGGLGWKNNIAVTPGSNYTVVVGAGGTAGTIVGDQVTTSVDGGVGGTSFFISTDTVNGGGGGAGDADGGASGTFIGDGGGAGGVGQSRTFGWDGGGGGGAGGYSGSGGDADNGQGRNPATNSGGGGAGASRENDPGIAGGFTSAGGNGGGVGLLGKGADGVGGGTGQISGGSTAPSGTAGSGGNFGGGGGGAMWPFFDGGATRSANAGGSGGVRIIWGTGRSYPSALTADQTTVGFVSGIPPVTTITEIPVDVFNTVRFYDNTYVKISTASGYSAVVQIYDTTTTSFTFVRPEGFPIEETDFSIESASTSVLTQSRSLTNFLASKAPYTFTRPMDRFVSSQVSPNPYGVRLYSSSTLIQGHVDNRQTSGQLLPRSNIKGVEPVIQPDTITKFTINPDTIEEIFKETSGIATWNPQFVIVSQNLQTQSVDDPDPANFYLTLFTGGIYQLTGVTLTTDSAGNILIESKLDDNQYRLESYDNIGVYENLNITAISQNNILYNTVQNYIDDLDKFTYSLATPPVTQTLFFRYNDEQPRLVAYPGHYILLTDAVSQYSATVLITASTADSISFTRPINFPNNYENQWSLQTATLFYYPKEKVFNDLVTTVLPFINITEPKQNLFISEYKPIQQERSISLFLDREFQDSLPLIKDTEAKLDNVFLQSEVTLTNAPNTPREALYYFNIAPGYRSNSTITQGFVFEKYNETDTGKLSNSAVLKGDTSVLAYSDTEFLPTLVSDRNSLNSANLSRDSIVVRSDRTQLPSAILSDYVNQFTLPTTVAPQRPRDLFYYSRIAPGYKSNSTIQQGISFEEFENGISRQNYLSKDIFRLKPDNAVLSVDVVKKGIPLKPDNAVLSSDIITKFKIDQEDSLIFTVPTSAELSSAVKAILPTTENSLGRLAASILVKQVVPIDGNGIIDNTFLQSQTTPTTSPSTPREALYYFNIAPGYRSNSTISQGIALDSSYKEPASTLFYPDRVIFPSTASEVFFTGELSSLISAIVVKENTIEENIGFTEIFRSPTIANEIFSLPGVGKLSAATIVRSYAQTIGLDNIDSFTNSLSVRFNSEPRSSSELYFMSLIAPGRKAGNLNTVFGSALDELSIVLDADEIVRYKTGEFKPGSVGIGDGAATRKEPIQFWN
jgi:hypothetical protein